MVLYRSGVDRLLLRVLLSFFNVLHHDVRFLLLVELRVSDTFVRRLRPLLVLLHEDILGLMFCLVLLQGW